MTPRILPHVISVIAKQKNNVSRNNFDFPDAVVENGRHVPTMNRLVD